MLAVGGHAPDFVLPALEGTDISLAQMSRSGPVVVAFFKVSCPTCQYTFPFLDRLSRAAELSAIGVSQDDSGATEEFCRACGVSFPVVLDQARAGYPVSNAYKITHVPSVFLVEENAVTEAFHGFSRRDLDRIAARFGASVFQPGEKVPDFRPG